MGPIIPKDKKPLISASYLNGLLSARVKANASSTATGSRRTKNSRRTAKDPVRKRLAKAIGLTKTDGAKSKKRPKRKKVWRRKQTKKHAVAKRPVKASTSVIPTQSNGDAESTDNEEPDEELRKAKAESWNFFLGTLSHNKPRKKKVKMEKLDKKPKVLVDEDIIVVSDDDNKPSTSTGRGKPSRIRTSGLRILSSSESSSDASDDDTFAPQRVASQRTSLGNVAPNSGTIKERRPAQEGSFPSTSRAVDKPVELTRKMCGMISTLLTIPPIAASIVKHLPMRSLNGLSQSCVLLRDICNQEKQQHRRQTFDWILRSSIITALDGQNRQNERMIFGTLLSDIYCEPEVVLVFCNARILYEYQMNVSSCRSPHLGELKVLADLISDLMPRAAGLAAPSKFVHVRTQSVLPPRPIPSTNTRKVDHYGCRESSRDLGMLFIPKMAGVNVWQERLSDSDLRKLLRDSGWLGNRTHNRFLLPIIKELEILAPKLVIIISQRYPNYDAVECPNFPVLVLNPLNMVRSDDNAVEWIAFGGSSATAYQIFLASDIRKQERKAKLRGLRDQFTTPQVMSGRMFLFYFRNVVRYEITPEETERLEIDITQLREEFPLIPIFGGGYNNVIGNEFTKNWSTETSGKFASGDLTTFVCAVLLGY
ncbi:hypothetical protein RvY_09957 [Ramazzottius varieornatus]|uniref:Uncharacterized protein n=1 Tax=Ramazzottius varieornatus TaxID=947166 RepID=A0A1D1VB44_RAMVA|nr:hypothetical protein RvY_09957 [Ramazzottius varieornatus]